MPWYVYIALRHLFPRGRFPLFTLISTVGVAAGVFLLVVVISVFNGFGHEIRTRISEAHGDIGIEAGGLFSDYQSFIAELEEDPRIDSAAPYAHGLVMMQHENRPLYPAIQGVDPFREQAVIPIADYLIAGSVEDFDDDSVLLSIGVARSLKVRTGEHVEIYTPLIFERLKQDEVLLPRSVRVAGIYETGWQEIDANSVLCTLRLMQDLYGLGDAAHGIKVRLAEGEDAEEVVRQLNREMPLPYRAFTWLSSYQAFLAAVNFEKRMMFFLLFVIVIVSAISIMSSLLVSVIRKTREIGLFSAMGASARETASCFCVQGLLVGIVGTILGFIAGFSLLSVRNELVNFFTRAVGMGDTMADVYGFSSLPIQVTFFDNALIAVLTIVASTLAGLVPAWKAGRLKPAEALRSE